MDAEDDGPAGRRWRAMWSVDDDSDGGQFSRRLLPSNLNHYIEPSVHHLSQGAGQFTFLLANFHLWASPRNVAADSPGKPQLSATSIVAVAIASRRTF